MPVYVALGGSADLGNEWAGYLIDQLNLKIPIEADFSYDRMTLNLQERSLDRVYQPFKPQDQPDWTTANVEERVEEIQQNSADLVLLQTPSSNNGYLDQLLKPVTHMIILTENRRSTTYNDWEQIAENNDIRLTHHIVTEEGGNIYERDDDGVIIIRPQVTTAEFDSGCEDWMKRSEAAAKLTEDLIQFAL